MSDKVNRKEVLQTVQDTMTPFSTEDGRLFCELQQDGKKRIISVRESGACDFRGYFTSFCVREFDMVPGGDFISSAQLYIADWVRTKGRKYKDTLRIGGTLDDLYIDIGDDTHDAWHVSAAGIRRHKGGPTHFKFLRGAGMLPLVEPDLTTPASELMPLIAKYIDAPEEQLMLIVAWLLGTIRPEGPYPVLTLSGEQGSGKSTTLRMLRRIADPHALDMRTPPEDQRDLQAMVRNSFMLAFDNVSHITNKMSDALCVISTGTGAQGGRALYTNAEESAVRVCRPVAMNGIPEVIERGDLVDRSIHVHLPRIAPTKRRDDSEYWAEFNADHPKILGALMNAAQAAIAGYKSVVLAEKPRMSAFAVWVAAAEVAMGWQPGRVLDIYKNNRTAAEAHLLEFNGVGSCVLRLMTEIQEFSGTYPDLMGKLEFLRAPGEYLPKSSHGLANELKRIMPALERVGIKVYNNGRSSDVKQKGRALISIAKEAD